MATYKPKSTGGVQTYNPKNQGHLTPKNNTVESFPFCRPDDYYTRIGEIPPKVYSAPEAMTSIWQHKIKANFEHNEQHEAMRYGGKPPAYDPKCFEMRHRWHEQYTKRGQSTFCKSKDGVVGA